MQETISRLLTDIDDEELINRGYIDREYANPEVMRDIVGDGEGDSVYPDFESAREALLNDLIEANEFKACGAKSVCFDLYVDVDIDCDGITLDDYEIVMIED